MAACVRFWQVLAAYDWSDSPFLRKRFGNPSVFVRKKGPFSEELPKKHRRRPGENSLCFALDAYGTLLQEAESLSGGSGVLPAKNITGHETSGLPLNKIHP